MNLAMLTCWRYYQIIDIGLSLADGGQTYLSFVVVTLSLKINSHKIDDMLQQSYFIESIPFLTTTTSLKTCGCSEALASTAIFLKCSAKIS